MFKKILATINVLLILNLFFLPLDIAQADMTDVGKVNSILGVKTPPDLLNSILKDYGFDKAEVQNAAKTFNTSRQKKAPPAVELIFSPVDPVEGEEITSTATPTYFLNEPKNLYFTWFLKRSICKDSTTSTNDQYKDWKNDFKDDFEVCNLNGDDEVDIEDYKIYAMRIIANGGFNYDKAKRDGTYNKDDEDTDNDGYVATFGGDDQKGKNEWCYYHNTESGNEFEITCDHHLFPMDYAMDTKGNISIPGDDHMVGEDKHTNPDRDGNDDFTANRENFWQTDPRTMDTARIGNIDEANVVGLGKNSFTWTYQPGDKVGVVVEGVSTEATQEKDSSYKTMFAMTQPEYEESYNIDSSIKAELEKRIKALYPTAVVTFSENPIIATGKDPLTNTDLITLEVLSEVNGLVNVEQTIIQTGDITNFTIDLSLDIPGNRSISKVTQLNPLLYKALISPAKNALASQKMDLSLSYTPENPVKFPFTDDPSDNNFSLEGNEADMLKLQASIPNVKDKNLLLYQWEVYGGDNPNTKDWEAYSKQQLPESTQTTGLGLDSFAFRLNFPNHSLAKDPKYLKIILTVTENVEGESFTRETTKSIIIKLSSNEYQLKTYEAETYADPAGVPKVKLPTQEKCTEGKDKIICPVVKNQIIGVTLPNDPNNPTKFKDFLWTIDGTIFSYKECFFDNCVAEKQTDVMYFPVLKEKGEKYAINLVATKIENVAGDAGNPDEKINLTRIFEVVDPEIEILCASHKDTDTISIPNPANADPEDDTNTGEEYASDNCRNYVLGNYIDINGKSWPDVSKNQLTGWFQDSPIKIKARTIGFENPPFLFGWNVDGDSFSMFNDNLVELNYSFDDDMNLVLPGKSNPGSYAVTVSTLYTQDQITKQTLNKYWDVGYNQFYEKTVSDDANIEILDQFIAMTPQKKKIFASIYSSAPAYLAFLLRIVLTISLIIFSSKLILSIIPRNEN